MKVNILKRLKALEDRLATVEKPQHIMIFYDEVKDGFLVREMYGGAKPEDYRHKEILMQHYSGYIFQENFDCNVTLDLIGVDGMEGDLFSFNIADIRKRVGLKENEGFAVQYIRDSSPEHGTPQAEFEIIVYERATGKE